MPKYNGSNWMMSLLKGAGGVGAAVALVLWVIHNIKCNDDFLQTSLHNIILLLISIVITYFLAQRRMDDRRKKDGLAKITEKLISSIQDSMNANIADANDWVQYLNSTRFISNKIAALKTACSNSRVIDDVRYIEDRFKALRELEEDVRVGYLQRDIEVPAERKLDLQKIKNDIISKCDAVLCEMYTT
jgi:hypothetical protein